MFILLERRAIMENLRETLYTMSQEQLVEIIIDLTLQLSFSEEKIGIFTRKLFGQSSEKISVDDQPAFNEDTIVDTKIDRNNNNDFNNSDNKPRKRTPRPAGKRAELFADLEVEEVVHELFTSQRKCFDCGAPFIEVGKKLVRSELVWVPGHFIRKDHYQVNFKESCDCSSIKGETTFVSSPTPKAVIPNSPVSPSTLALVIDSKYALHLPLYRQAERFLNQGFGISRQMMCNWVILGCNRWLILIYNYLKNYLLLEEVLHADETFFQVLKELGRSATSMSKMWIYSSGAYGKYAIYLYDYTPTRKGENAKNFLPGYSGYLIVDGYTGYNSVTDATIVNCWDHARRKFFETLDGIPKEQWVNTNAFIGLSYCNQLAAIERELKDLSNEERYMQRFIKSSPILDKFFTWLDEMQPLVIDNNFGKAVKYCLKYERGLLGFMLDGRLQVSNNRCERAVKPVALGRKNYLFADSEKGARASAIAYSVIETAKAYDLVPYEYLNFLFEELPNRKDLTNLDDLMPWAEKVQVRCKALKKQSK